MDDGKPLAFEPLQVMRSLPVLQKGERDVALQVVPAQRAWGGAQRRARANESSVSLELFSRDQGCCSLASLKTYSF